MKKVQQIKTIFPIGRSEERSVCTTSFRPGALLITRSGLNVLKYISTTFMFNTAMCYKKEQIFTNCQMYGSKLVHQCHCWNKADEFQSFYICIHINDWADQNSLTFQKRIFPFYYDDRNPGIWNTASNKINLPRVSHNHTKKNWIPEQPEDTKYTKYTWTTGSWQRH